MGKLLTGRYGEPPEAESVAEIPLRDCRERLSLKPTDFVSEGEPKFFEKSFDAGGRYLVFHVSPNETAGNTIWKAGYYLLPLSTLDVLKAYGKTNAARASVGGRVLPVAIESKVPIPDDVKARLDIWTTKAQPLFFKCKCDSLELKLEAPWALRRRWKARLRCPDRCQPTMIELI